MSLCSITGCTGEVKARRMCMKHYMRVRKHGSPHKVLQIHKKRGGKSGMFEHRLYVTFTNILQRCYNKNHPGYRYYGARGVRVCDRWQAEDGFVKFLEDMGEKPSDKHSIDRIDNDGDYEPSNCRWATQSEQLLNQRKRGTC